jgi:hypothetical protein
MKNWNKYWELYLMHVILFSVNIFLILFNIKILMDSLKDIHDIFFHFILVFNSVFISLLIGLLIFIIYGFNKLRKLK